MYCGCGRATPPVISGKRSAAFTSASNAAQSAAMSPPQRRLDAGVALGLLNLGEPQRQAGHELELHAEPHECLEVGRGVRGRLVELGVHEVDIAVDEDLLPGDEHVVEDDRGVDLVEPR